MKRKIIPETNQLKSDKKATRSLTNDKVENSINVRRSLPE